MLSLVDALTLAAVLWLAAMLSLTDALTLALVL